MDNAYVNIYINDAQYTREDTYKSLSLLKCHKVVI